MTGVLAETGSREALSAALSSALAMASSPDAADRADQARALVTERFSIQTMASALAAIYQEVSHDSARHQP